MKYQIYKITSPSGKSYVGQTRQSSLMTRWNQHVRGWKRWEKAGQPRKAYITKLFYAISKYGPENFTVELLEVTTPAMADERERHFISQLNSVENGYNLTHGGQGWVSMTFSDEHKQKISQARQKFYMTDEGKKWRKQLSEKFQVDNLVKKGNIPWNKGIKAPQCGNEKAKRYMVTFPDGTTHEVINLKKFCRENGLDDRNITRYSSKGHKAQLIK